MTWWNVNWTYRRRITIDNTNNPNNLTDYTVKVTLTTSNFDYSKCNADGSDIRFIDSDDTTELNYWTQEWDNTGNSIIWVKVPSIPSNSTKTIYMYYGNSSASSNSNIQNTFVLGREWDNPPYTPPGSGTTGNAEGFETGVYYPHPTLVANDLPTRGIDHNTTNAHDNNSLYIIARKDGRNCLVYAKKTLTATEAQNSGKLGYKIRVKTTGTTPDPPWEGQLGGGIDEIGDGVGLSANRWLYNDSAPIDVSEQDELDFTVYNLDGAQFQVRGRTWDQSSSGSYAEVWCDWLYLRKMLPWKDGFESGNLDGWTTSSASVTTGGGVGTYCVAVSSNGYIYRQTNGSSGEVGLHYSAWVKFTNTTSDKAYFVLLQENSSSLGNNYAGIWLEYDSVAGGMTFKLKVNNGGSLATYNIYTIPAGSESDWYQVHISFNKFKNQVIGYVVNSAGDTRFGRSSWQSCSSNPIYGVKAGVEGSSTAYFDEVTWRYNGDPSTSVEITTEHIYDGNANLSISGLTKTSTGNASLSVSHFLNKDGNSRIVTTKTKPVGGNARLQIFNIKSAAGTARLELATEHIYNSTARLQVTSTKQASGNTRLSISFSKIASANSRIAISQIKQKAGNARLELSYSLTKSANARVQVTNSIQKAGTARLQVYGQTIQKSGNSRLSIVSEHIYTGNANLQVSGLTKTATGTSRVVVSQSKSYDGYAYTYLQQSKQATGNSKIYIVPMIAHPFQRKVWNDGTRDWRAHYNYAENRIEFWYTTDHGVTWTENVNARLPAYEGVDADGHYRRGSDFSISLAGDGNLIIIYTDGDNVYAREVSGTYPGTDWTWGSETTVWSASPNIKYTHVDISEDASSYAHATVTKHDLSTGKYWIVHKAYSAKNTITGGSWSAEDIISDTNNTSRIVMGSFRKASTNIFRRGLLVYCVGTSLYYRTYDQNGFGPETFIANIKGDVATDTFCHEPDRPSAVTEKTNHIVYIASDGSLRYRGFTWSGGLGEESIIDSNTDCTSPTLNSIQNSTAFYVWYMRGTHQNASQLYRCQCSDGASPQLVYQSTNGMLSMSAPINGSGVMVAVQENPYTLLWFVEALAYNGNARLTKSFTSQYNGTARIEVTQTADKSGNANLVLRKEVNKTGNADILATVTKLVSGNADITKTIEIAKTGSAYLYQTKSANYIGNARLTITNEVSYAGAARIVVPFTTDYLGNARLLVPTIVDKSANARLIKTLFKAYSGIANLQVSQSLTKAGNSRLAIGFEHVYIGNARLSVSGLQKTAAGIARLSIAYSITKSSLARLLISQTTLKAGSARLLITYSLLKSGLARLLISQELTKSGNSQLCLEKEVTYTGDARLAVTQTKSLDGDARIEISPTSGYNGNARLEITQSINKNGNSRIYSAKTWLKRVEVITPELLSVEAI